MLTLSQFRALFPEFTTATDPLVQSRLDQAGLLLDVDVWGNRFDIGHGLKAAHLLAISPYGQMARMVASAGKAQASGSTKLETTYGKQFEELAAQVAGLVMRAI